MRAFVYFLSFLLVVAPMHAYAVLPILPAIVGHATGEIAVGTSKAVIKKMSNETKKDLVKSATAICSKSTALASFCGGVVSAVVGNSLEVEVNNVNNNNDIDVNIYKKKSNKCNEYQTYITSQQLVEQHSRLKNGGSVAYLSEYFISESQIEQAVRDLYSKPYKKSYGFSGNMTFYKDSALQALSNYKASNSLDKYDVGNGEFKTVSAFKAEVSPHNFNDKPILKHDYYYVLVVIGSSCNSKNEITEQDIDNIFNSLSDDDITNIYNYDYSQHNVITVNNNTTTGNNINNSKNNFDENYTNKELSENATNKMKNGDKDYTIDKINDKNCSKNDKGEYDKCGKDKDKTDEDIECKENEVLINGECRERKGDEQDNQDEQIILFCKENPELCRKIFEIEDNTDDLEEQLRDILDWADDEAEAPTDTEVDIEDLETEKISGDKVDFKQACPDGIGFSYSIFRYSYTTEFNVKPLCDYAKGINFYMQGSALLASIYIIVGRRND